MNTPRISRQTENQRLRKALIDAILFRIAVEVEIAISGEVPVETRTAILDEIRPNARYMLSALDNDELQNDHVLDGQIANAVATARYFVDRIVAQRNRS